jgi:hypothetical protein
MEGFSNALHDPSGLRRSIVILMTLLTSSPPRRGSEPLSGCPAEGMHRRPTVVQTEPHSSPKLIANLQPIIAARTKLVNELTANQSV